MPKNTEIRRIHIDLAHLIDEKKIDASKNLGLNLSDSQVSKLIADMAKNAPKENKDWRIL